MHGRPKTDPIHAPCSSVICAFLPDALDDPTRISWQVTSLVYRFYRCELDLSGVVANRMLLHPELSLGEVVVSEVHLIWYPIKLILCLVNSGGGGPNWVMLSVTLFTIYLHALILDCNPNKLSRLLADNCE